MQVTVSGKQVELSDALRTHVNTQLGVITDKYFERAQEARVLFTRSRDFFVCAVNVHVRHGMVLRGEGEAATANAAFDVAAQHMAKQLRRHRRRISEHARSIAYRERSEPAMLSVLRADPDDDVGEEVLAAKPELNGHAVNGRRAPADADLPPPGLLVPEGEIEIVEMTMGVAVMRMDFEAQQCIMFRNSETQKLNVIYRRPDGAIGWIEPKGTSPV